MHLYTKIQNDDNWIDHWLSISFDFFDTGPNHRIKCAGPNLWGIIWGVPDFEVSHKWAKGFFQPFSNSISLLCWLDDMPQGFENEIKTEFHSQL